MLIAVLKYAKKYKRYLLIILPLFSFGFYWAFIIFRAPHDFGRYTFPLWFILFLFTSKFLASIRSNKMRVLSYLLIFCFCAVSLASAYGISWQINSIDSQVLQINKALRDINAQGVFISNDEFTASSLNFYLQKPVIFNMSKNVIDTNVKCEGDIIFNSKNFEVFKEDEEYRICRK
jgi:hypothetical protein